MTADDIIRLTGRIDELEHELADLKSSCERQLVENLSKYRRVIDSTSEGYLELDQALTITDCNSAILTILAREKQELLHKSFNTLYDKNSVFPHFANRNHLSFEAQFESGNGASVPLLCKRSIFHDADGGPGGYLVLVTDLTDLKRAQERLQDARDRFRIMYNNAVQGMYECTIDGHFISVNPALARTFDFDTTTDFIRHFGGGVGCFSNPDDHRKLLSLVKERGVVKNYEVEMVKPDGKTVWALISMRLSEDTLGKPVIEGILIDNTEQKLAEQRLRVSRERFRYLAIHDNLTGLYNTRHLYKALDRMVTESGEAGTPFSLVFLDMDNFKRVVDTYGHLNGSQVLKEVAATLQESIEDPAFGVAYGGDEFVLVLPGKGKQAALEQVRNVRASMKKTTYLQNKGLAVRMSASFGIATFPDDAGDRDSLLALADEALFAVKSAGKDAIGTAEFSGIP
ncbi:MAG: sensor domain-containing diguanylate cyclase [Desulfofustis sp.]|nr:sensor domain-containing diguanylate cyclase [Desulfofustis sp.]